jgi:hypothetical protein
MSDSSPLGIDQAIKLITDSYERKARLYPALLLLMPVAVVICSGLGSNLTLTKTICGLIVSCGGLLLIAQLARDAGTRKQQGLFDQWGGMPSVSVFRHRDSCVDPITKANYHKKMETLVSGAKAPSIEQEKSNPDGVDQVYAAWSTYVRVNTRDTKRYFLLFQENINYGYRRNVFGLRPIGITITTLSAAGAFAWSYLRYKMTGQISVELAFAGAFATLLLLFWLFRVTAAWVRIPAQAYAERLAEAVGSLSAKGSK